MSIVDVPLLPVNFLIILRTVLLVVGIATKNRLVGGLGAGLLSSEIAIQLCQMKLRPE